MSIRSALFRQLYGVYYRTRLSRTTGYIDGSNWVTASNRLSKAELEQRQLNRLAKLVNNYLELGLLTGEKLRRFASSPDLAAYGGLPVMEKADIRALLPRVREKLAGLPGVYLSSTSGSTGEPTQHLRDQLLNHLTKGADDEMFKLAGCQPLMKRICLWGNPDELVTQQGFLARLKRKLSPTAIVAAYAPGMPEFNRFLALIKAYPNCTVYGYSSLVVECGRMMLRTGRQIAPGHVSAGWVTSEVISKADKEILRAAFGVEFADLYGSSECSAIAVECKRGQRHINPRYLLEVEASDGSISREPTEPGELLFSDTFNHCTPFLRYRLGDLGRPEWRSCDCGLTGWTLPEMNGRSCDLIRLPSGRSLHTIYFNMVLKDNEKVHRFQATRLTDENYRLDYIGEEMSEMELAKLSANFAELMEGARLSIERVSELKKSKSGKLLQYFDERPAQT